jgi:hypothetical protein
MGVVFKVAVNGSVDHHGLLYLTKNYLCTIARTFHLRVRKRIPLTRIRGTFVVS